MGIKWMSLFCTTKHIRCLSMTTICIMKLLTKKQLHTVYISQVTYHNKILTLHVSLASKWITSITCYQMDVRLALTRHTVVQHFKILCAQLLLTRCGILQVTRADSSLHRILWPKVNITVPHNVTCD